MKNKKKRVQSQMGKKIGLAIDYDGVLYEGHQDELINSYLNDKKEKEGRRLNQLFKSHKLTDEAIKHLDLIFPLGQSYFFDKENVISKLTDLKKQGISLSILTASAYPSVAHYLLKRGGFGHLFKRNRVRNVSCKKGQSIPKNKKNKIKKIAEIEKLKYIIFVDDNPSNINEAYLLNDTKTNSRGLTVMGVHANYNLGLEDPKVWSQISDKIITIKQPISVFQEDSLKINDTDKWEVSSISKYLPANKSGEISDFTSKIMEETALPHKEKQNPKNKWWELGNNPNKEEKVKRDIGTPWFKTFSDNLSAEEITSSNSLRKKNRSRDIDAIGSDKKDLILASLNSYYNYNKSDKFNLVNAFKKNISPKSKKRGLVFLNRLVETFIRMNSDTELDYIIEIAKSTPSEKTVGFTGSTRFNEDEGLSLNSSNKENKNHLFKLFEAPSNKFGENNIKATIEHRPNPKRIENNENRNKGRTL